MGPSNIAIHDPREGLVEECGALHQPEESAWFEAELADADKTFNASKR